MNASLPALTTVLVVLSGAIWLVTEALARALTASGLKGRGWAQLALHLAPIALGAIACGVPGAFAWLMDLAGYAPKSPPSAGTAALLGSLAGAGASVYHDKIGALVTAWAARRAPKPEQETAP